jgi:hypothetical protein
MEFTGQTGLVLWKNVFRETVRCAIRPGADRLSHGATAFSLQVYTEQPLPTWLFLKKSRTSLNLTVLSRSENALMP